MEIIKYVADMCTTKGTSRDSLMFLLNFIYDENKEVLKLLNEIKRELEMTNSILVMEGLYNLLLKHFNNEMLEFGRYHKVNKYIINN